MTERVEDTRVLWAGMLAGPVAWVLQGIIVYPLCAWGCSGGPWWLLHLTSLVMLLAAAGGMYLSWRHWRGVGGMPGSGEGAALGRTRLMAVLGVMSGALFTVAIFVEWLAVIVLPCGYEVMS